MDTKFGTLPPCGIFALGCVVLVLEWCWGRHIWKVNVLLGVCCRMWPSCPNCWSQVALFTSFYSHDIKLFNFSLVFCPDKQLCFRSFLMHLLREIFIIAGVSQRRWVEFFKIAEKGLYMLSWHLLLAQALCYSFAGSTRALKCASEGAKCLEGEGGFQFYDCVSSRVRGSPSVGCCQRQICFQAVVCLAAGVPWLKLLKLFVKLQPKSLVFLEA